MTQFAEDSIALSEEITLAVFAVIKGHPQSHAALAMTAACGAIVSACAKPGQEAEALRASVFYLEQKADQVMRRGLQ